MRTTLSSQFDTDQRKEWKPKIVARNTFRYERDGETVVRLHETDIVRKRSDGSVILNSGGWKTVTTKDRMNYHLPAGYAIYQERGLWYVLRRSDRLRVSYFDGIRVPQCFDKIPAKAAQAEQREKKLRAQIQKFVSKLDKLECLPEPSAGDCFYCQMRVVDSGKPLGEATGNNDHILEHIREGYLHGSLILNALRWAGYRVPEVIWQLANRDLQGKQKPAMVKRALKRYLYRQCGLVG